MQYFSLPTNLMNAVMNLNRRGSGRTIEVSMVIARLLAYKACIDTKVDAAANCSSSLNGTFDIYVSEINSLIPLNLTDIRDITRKWLGYRYDQIVGFCPAPYARENQECEDFFGMSRHFDTELLKAIKDNAENMKQNHLIFHELISIIDTRIAAASSKEGAI